MDFVVYIHIHQDPIQIHKIQAHHNLHVQLANHQSQKEMLNYYKELEKFPRLLHQEQVHAVH